MSVRFEVPADARFECSRCGDCCRTWNVMVSSGEAEGLRALDWSGREPALAGVAPVVKPARSPARLARRDDGACVFLGSRNQCLIHEHFGPQEKPLACRLYPFGFLPVGDRVAVDVAWSCRAVSEGMGEPVALREPEWARQLAELGRGPSGEDRHLLRPGMSMPGDVLWDFEHHLVAILSLEDLSWLDRLRCAAELMTLTSTGDPTNPTAPVFRKAMATALPRKVRPAPAEAAMDPTQAAVFFQWLFLALNPAPPQFDVLPPFEQEREARRRVAAATRFRDREGHPWVDNRQLAVDFAAVARVDAGVLPGRAAELVGPFLRAKVVGQRFLACPDGELPLVEGVARLLLLYPMCAWTAKAMAAERGAAAAEEQDVRRALRLLDRTLGQVSLAALPKKQQEAFSFVMNETDLLTCATLELGAC